MRLNCCTHWRNFSRAWTDARTGENSVDISNWMQHNHDRQTYKICPIDAEHFHKKHVNTYTKIIFHLHKKHLNN